METIQETLDHLPHEPGVYIYHDETDAVIYVGKAVDLSRRVKQYFQREDAVGDKTRRLVSEIRRIEIIPVTSEFDALLLEAKLIRQYMPKYNVISKDDKSPLYIGFTLHEPLPRLVYLRKGQLAAILAHKKNVVYGPFQSAHALRALLRQLRSAVPYCTQKERNGRACFYTHLGLCDPCPSVIAKTADAKLQALLIKQYRNNIHRLKAIFDGHTAMVRRHYEREMRGFARSLEFEQAALLKKRIDALYRISEYRYDPAVFLEQGAEDVYADELAELHGILQTYYPGMPPVLSRIECFDMSQLFGVSAVGSMVVLTDGKPDTGQYRRFRIRMKGPISDTGMMREVLARRLRHPEWPPAQFVLIDGGKPQLRMMKEVLQHEHKTLSYAGLAKRQEELIVPIGDGYKTVRLPLTGKAIKVLQRVRDEAHRFAITYHRKLREKRTFSV